MGGRINYLRKHPLFWTLLISLLLHLLFLLFFLKIQGIQIGLENRVANDLSNTEPLVFKIIESRDESLEKPENASLFSDKQSLAKDMKPDGSGAQPFSESGIAFESIPEINQEKEVRAQDETPVDKSSTQLAERDIKPVYSKKNTNKFNKDKLLNKQMVNTATVTQPAFKQTSESAEDFGGLSFNTYAWDYAPYLLELKKRIQKNIFPPPAFTHLGFGGINKMRFRIMPDGQLIGPFLVNSSGEEALIETSKKAIEISAPFLPLPEDFPEPYLEVTAQFSYTTYSSTNQ